ncbi:hypothetical protein KFE25_000738 [Diacronema lutheri]|uniref:50S ribosomal protein L35 n=1 Tax=Diacronema lutheri TaxID=2081491 RepID=A0A8J6CAA9_DIALT|nr:hypothetical protein KFE25_000738 [Diacronema lutheri]
MKAIFLVVALAVAGASATAELAFIGGGALSMARRPESCAVSAVQMRGPKPSTKLKGAKVRSSVAKRFKMTAGGKILRRRANKQHLLFNKKHKNKKHAGKIGQVSSAMIKTYTQILSR